MFILVWGAYGAVVLVVLARPVVWGLHTRWQTVLGISWGLGGHAVVALLQDRFLPFNTAAHLPGQATWSHRKKRFVTMALSATMAYVASLVLGMLLMTPFQFSRAIRPLSFFALDLAAGAMLIVSLLKATSSQPGPWCGRVCVCVCVCVCVWRGVMRVKRVV